MCSLGDAVLFGSSTWSIHAGEYQFKWLPAKGRLTRNENGTTGWANIIHSTNPTIVCHGSYRVHLCKHNPCRAWHNDTKYGGIGPPMHLQEVPPPGEPSAVADPSGAPLAVAAQTAVADLPSAVADLPCEPPSDLLECVAIVPPLSIGAGSSGTTSGTCCS